jgi:hypothetical protein
MHAVAILSFSTISSGVPVGAQIPHLNFDFARDLTPVGEPEVEESSFLVEQRLTKTQRPELW